MRRILLVLALLLGYSVAAHAAAGCAAQSGGTNLTSCAVTYSAGDAAIVVVSTQGTPVVPTDSCGNTYLIIPRDGDYSGGDSRLYWIPTVATSGSCTVSYTEGSGAWTTMAVLRYPGLASYGLEMIPPQIFNVGSGTTISWPTLQAGDLVAVLAGFGNPSGTIGTTSPGWTTDENITDVKMCGSPPITPCPATGVMAFSKSIASPSTVSNTMTWGGQGSAYMIIFRTANPTFGMMQQGMCTNYPSASSSLTCFTFYPVTAGDHLRVAYSYDNVAAPITLSNSQSILPVGPLPSSSYVDYANEIYDHTILSTTTSPMSFTFTGSGSGKIDMIFWEVKGLAPTGWLASSTLHVVAPTESVSTNFDSGSVYLQQAGTYYADSVTAIGGESVQNYNSSTTGFAPRFLGDYGYFSNRLNGLYDKTVVIASPSGVNNNIALTNPLTTIGQTSFNMLLLSGASTYLYPVTVATTGKGGIGTLSPSINEATPSCLLINSESLEVNASGTWSINSSPTLTWTPVPHGGCTSSDQYCIQKSSSVPAGAITVNSAHTSGNRAVDSLVKTCNVNSIDVSNSGISAASSVGPVNVTTTQNNEFIAIYGVAGGSSFGPGIQISPTSGTNSTLRIPLLTDPVSVYNYDAIAPTIGTYGASLTCDGGCGNMIEVVLGLTFSAPAAATGSQFYGLGQHYGNSEIR